MDPEELQDKSDLVGVVEELQQEVLELSERVDSLPTEPVVIEGPPGPAGESIQGPAGKDAVPPSLEELEAIILPLIPDPIPGNDGADPTPLFKTLEDKVNKRLNSLGGGNLPGRQWNVNSSVLGTTFLDVNIIAPGATVTNNPDTKRTDLTLPSGGGTPGGMDTQVQFNDNGAFGGSSRFTFDKSEGGNVLIAAGDNSAGNGGSTNISSGNGGATGSGGSFAIVSGSAPVQGNGGSFQLLAGQANGEDVSGGSVNLIAGDGGSGGMVEPSQGGAVNLFGGNGATGGGEGGSVELAGGSAMGGDSDGGSISITPGLASGVGSPGFIFVQNLPSGDPGVPGAIYQVGGVLMISL